MLKVLHNTLVGEFQPLQHASTAFHLAHIFSYPPNLPMYKPCKPHFVSCPSQRLRMESFIGVDTRNAWKSLDTCSPWENNIPSCRIIEVVTLEVPKNRRVLYFCTSKLLGKGTFELVIPAASIVRMVLTGRRINLGKVNGNILKGFAA